MAVKKNRFLEAKNKSIISYLEKRGIHTEKRGHKYWCSSPFSSDSVWSFAIYPNNTFYDWANGKGGDIIDLVSLLDQTSLGKAVDTLLGIDLDEYEPSSWPGGGGSIKRPFKLKNYVYRITPQVIADYAKERKIKNYTAGKWMLNLNDEDNTWVEVPSLMFKHYDEHGKLTGARFRTLEVARDQLETKCNMNVPKFNSRGILGWHILENKVKGSFKEAPLYIMESETSATSLYQYFQEKGYPVVILCFGGVYNKILPIPAKYKDLKKYLLIDYDGDEEKFNERIEKISLKETEPLKLILEKGEDINSLYCREEMYKVSYLLR